MVNAYANWLTPFLKNGWSLLDLVVVCMSWVALTEAALPVSLVRLIRAFRVIRLFGRFKVLRKTIFALMASIIPVLNAFAIIFVIASICSFPPLSSFLCRLATSASS
jgi:hypothetical protein